MKPILRMLILSSLVIAPGCQNTNSFDFDNVNNINYFGRVFVTENCVEFYNTCSGFEISFYGKELFAKFSSGFNQYLRVYVDGADNGIVKVQDKTKLCSNLDEEKHTVKVIRTNSEGRGTLQLNNLYGYLQLENAPAKSNLKFEFYGDSLTAGSEVNNDGTGDSTSNEDGTKAYAQIVSDHFNAEASMICYPGVSVSIPKWVSNWVLPEYYDQYSLTANKTKWNLNNYIADYIVINLGTNDAAAISESNKEQFYVGYLNFLNNIRTYNSSAHIVCCYGMGGANELVVQGIEKSIHDFQDDNVSFLKMNFVECDSETNHPTENGQLDAANQLKIHLEQFIR